MELYKYIKQVYCENFFKDGAIRLGTLKSYRDSETHGKLVSDEREGQITFGGKFESLTAEEIRSKPILSAIISVDEGTIFTAKNVSFENCKALSEDLYIFSASSEYSEGAHDQWLTHEGYDCCYKINSARLFFKAISHEIENLATFLGYAPVAYYDSASELDAHSPLAYFPPSQLKGGKDYGFQCEVRGFWKPKVNGDISPIDINVPGAIKYCERYRHIEIGKEAHDNEI